LHQEHYWGGDGNLDLENLQQIFFAVKKKADAVGWLKLDELFIEKGKNDDRESATPLPEYYKLKKPLISERKKAAEWIASQQTDNGWVTSYIGDAKPFGWSYDQSLALIVLAHEYPDKAILTLHDSPCPNMHKIDTGKLLSTLETIGQTNVVTVPDDIIRDSRLALDRMLTIAS